MGDAAEGSLANRVCACFSATYVERGAAVAGLVVAHDLIAMLERWKPYGRHGLIAVEGHVPTHNHRPTQPRPEYPQPHPYRWGMHYISEQYLLSFRENLLVYALAGFRPVTTHGFGRLYPERFPLASDLSPALRPRSVVRAIPFP